jgi:hypothetical protein
MKPFSIFWGEAELYAGCFNLVLKRRLQNACAARADVSSGGLAGHPRQLFFLKPWRKPASKEAK